MAKSKKKLPVEVEINDSAVKTKVIELLNIYEMLKKANEEYQYLYGDMEKRRDSLAGEIFDELSDNLVGNEQLIQRFGDFLAKFRGPYERPNYSYETAFKAALERVDEAMRDFLNTILEETQKPTKVKGQIYYSDKDYPERRHDKDIKIYENMEDFDYGMNDEMADSRERAEMALFDAEELMDMDSGEEDVMFEIDMEDDEMYGEDDMLEVEMGGAGGRQYHKKYSGGMQEGGDMDMEEGDYEEKDMALNEMLKKMKKIITY